MSTEDTGIAIVAKVQFGALGIPLTVTAGYISLGVDLLKDVRLTTAIIENASLAAGESETDLSVEHALLQLVPEDPQLPPLFAGIVNPIITALVSKTPLPIEKLTVFFTDLHFGPSSSDAFKCLSKIVYPMVIDLKSLFTGSSSLAVPVVGMSSDELPAPETKSSSSFIQGLEITATDVGLSAGLKLNLTQLNLPKLSIKIGYLDAGIFAGSSPTTLSKLGSVDVAKLDGSTLSPDLDLGLSLDVTGRDAAALDFVAALVNAVLPALPVPTKPGTVPPPPPPPPSAFVSLSSLYFGSSAEHKISLLSQVVLTLDAIKLIGSGRVGAEKSVGEDVSVIAEEETQAPSVSVKSVKGELGKNSLILDLGLALPLPFPLVAKLGYAGLRIDMSDKKIATGALMLTNLAVNPGGSTEARVELAFDETAASRLRLQQLILQLTNTVDKSDQIFFKQVVFGASSATKVDLFSKVNYRLPLKFKVKTREEKGKKK